MKTNKTKLTNANRIAIEVKFTHCNEKQYAGHVLLNSATTQVLCCECRKLILVKSVETNEWYYVGEKVFK